MSFRAVSKCVYLCLSIPICAVEIGDVCNLCRVYSVTICPICLTWCQSPGLGAEFCGIDVAVPMDWPTVVVPIHLVPNY